MPNIRKGRVFPNSTAANAALSTAHATWNPPPYTFVGPPPHATEVEIGPQKLATPIEMNDGTFVVFDVDHPSFKSHDIDIDNRKPDNGLQNKVSSNKK